MTDWLNKTHIGDCRELLAWMVADGVRVQTCITSPPYFGLRDYGCAGQIGLEPSPAEYVEQMVAVFRLVREVLAEDGTLWLNLGDSYAGGKTGRSDTGPADLARRQHAFRTGTGAATGPRVFAQRIVPDGLKQKDLIGIPWRVAFALQSDGWYLRSDIIWHKPSPMPESVTDRPTKAHEYIFLLAKSERYYYNAAAIMEPTLSLDPAHSSYRPNSAVISETGRKEFSAKHAMSARAYDPAGRNRRSVWTVATTPFTGAHFATFPRALIEPCILAGSRPGDTVLDPFMGSGTAGQVATDLGRNFIGTELNPKYVDLQEMRRTTIGMPI